MDNPDVPTRTDDDGQMMHWDGNSTLNLDETNDPRSNVDGLNSSSSPHTMTYSIRFIVIDRLHRAQQFIIIAIISSDVAVIAMIIVR